MVYFVYRTDDGQTHARLITSKTRVAPLKELFIPRFELMSASTGTTDEHSTQRNTVTIESRWREILARQQNSSQLDPEQGRMEAVRVT